MLKHIGASVVGLGLLVACGGGGGDQTPSTTTPITVAPAQPPTLAGKGIEFQTDQTGEVQYNILIIRGEFSDQRRGLSNDSWNDEWRLNLEPLQRHLTEYGYGRVNISAKTSSNIQFSQSRSAGFALADLDSLFRQGYRDIAATSADDDLEDLDNADIVIFSYPSIPHDQAGGAFGLLETMWMPGELFAGG